MRKIKRLIIAIVAMHAILNRDGIYWQSGGNENLKGAEPNFTAEIAFQFADAIIKKEKS